MIRVVKPEGFGNVQLEDVPVPAITERQVLVKTKATLISRGSELFGRYIREESVDPARMGYSLSGVVEDVGGLVKEVRIGERLVVVAAHAEYAVGDIDVTDTSAGLSGIVPLPDEVSFDAGAFVPLATSALAWAETAGVREGDTVVIMGQGLVGSLMLQTTREYKPGRIVVVDALPLRCRMAGELGADVVINAAENDPVEEVRRLTGGEGADVVMECVGGPLGVRSFEQAQQMLRRRGTLQLIALYHARPLPLDASKIMNKRLLAGILVDEPRHRIARRAVKKIRDGVVQAERMITHRFPHTEAKAAFDLLWECPGDTLGVILTWD